LTRPQVGHFEVAIRGDRDLINFYIRYTLLNDTKILSVADVVEAMASHRPYRAALGLDRAVEEISKNSGILYDPDVVDAGLRLLREKGFEF